MLSFSTTSKSFTIYLHQPKYGYLAELLERDFSVVVFVSLDDGPVDQLLQLNVVQVVPHHHLQHSEQLSIGNVAVVIHVVDLEGEPHLLFVGGAGRQGVEPLDELQEGDTPILVLVEHRDHSLHQRVLSQLYTITD